MKQTINNILTKVALAALFMFLPNVHSWAAEDDAHDFEQSFSQLLNNNASISSISIDQQSYPVKKVIVNYRYNKTIENAVTVEVSVGGNTWGAKYTEGTGSNYSTLEFEGESTTGAIVISFTNNTGSGTGHGTFYVNNVQLVEGASGTSTKCAAPTFSPAAGSYSTAQNVTISTTTEGATIYYTTDGTDPTSASSAYTSAISVNQNTTIKAIAVKDGLEDSNIATAEYILKCEKPTYNVTTGTYFSAQNVTLQSSTEGASIYYTTDGTDPTSSSILYESPISVSQTTVLRAIAVRSGWTSSDIAYSTITIVKPATLPFTFNSGKSAINPESGLVQKGLGSDYNSAPFLKFDNTEDYVILMINQAPGVLTYDIKGNGFSGGTFKVQASADGVNYEDIKTYTTLGDTQSETITNLAATVRYIKWIYTDKSNGNVALGNITLAKPTARIDLESYAINAEAAGVDDGSIALTYQNFSVSKASDFAVQFYDSNNAEINDPSWVTAVVEGTTNYTVSYIVDANTSEARTAYFKVWALDGETPVYSNLVTVSQAEYIAPPTGVDYSLFSGEISEGDYIIYYNGKAMNNVVESDRLQYESIEPIGSVITTDNASIVWHIAKSGDYWTIYNASGNKYAASTGAKNKAQLLESGTDDMSLWTVSGSGTYEFVNKENATRSINAYLRNNGDYGFACYAESTGGALTLYKKVTSNITATLNSGMYWATFYSSDQYSLPEGCKAYYLNSSKELHIVGTTGHVIPANTAVVIISDVETITLSKSAYDISFDSSTNILKGSTIPVAKSGVSGTVYVLGVVDGVIGFYKFSGENIPANKAYYNE